MTWQHARTGSGQYVVYALRGERRAEDWRCRRQTGFVKVAFSEITMHASFYLTEYKLPIFDCRLPIGTSRTSSFEFPVSSFEFPVSSFEFRVSKVREGGRKKKNLRTKPPSY
jgi:hypothetical protein